MLYYTCQTACTTHAMPRCTTTHAMPRFTKHAKQPRCTTHAVPCACPTIQYVQQRQADLLVCLLSPLPPPNLLPHLPPAPTPTPACMCMRVQEMTSSDPQLAKHADHLNYRWRQFVGLKERIEAAEGSLVEFATVGVARVILWASSGL